MKSPVNVAITGAAGQIGYALAFRVASGQMLGADQPINLHLLEITPALPALQGVVMELNDCAFPDAQQDRRDRRSQNRIQGLRRRAAGRRAPARPGHGAQGSAARERADLLGAGQSARRSRESQRARAGRRQSREHERADRSAQRARPEPAQFHGDDAPRSQPRAGAARGEDRHAHHATSASRSSGAITPRPSIPDLHHALVDGKPALSLVDQKWYRGDFYPDRAAARRGDHQGARPVVRCFRGLGSDRSRARLGEGHGGRRLGQHGRAVRRQLRHPGRRHLWLSRDAAGTATTRSCRASRSTTSAASAWTPRTRNCSKSATASKI